MTCLLADCSHICHVALNINQSSEILSNTLIFAKSSVIMMMSGFWKVKNKPFPFFSKLIYGLLMTILEKKLVLFC